MSKPKHTPGKGQLAGSSTTLDKPQCFIVGEGRWDHHLQLCNQLSCIVQCFPLLVIAFHPSQGHSCHFVHATKIQRGIFCRAEDR